MDGNPCSIVDGCNLISRTRDETCIKCHLPCLELHNVKDALGHLPPKTCTPMCPRGVRDSKVIKEIANGFKIGHWPPQRQKSEDESELNVFTFPLQVDGRQSLLMYVVQGQERKSFSFFL